MLGKIGSRLSSTLAETAVKEVQQQSVSVTKLGRLAEISVQEALQQAVLHTTGELTAGRVE